MALLVAAYVATAPALAEEDDLVPLPKLTPQKSALPYTPRQMEVACIRSMSTDEFEGHFSVAELNTAIQMLNIKIMGLLSDDLDNATPDPDIAKQVAYLKNQAETLRTCQLYEYTLDLIPRAATSCKGLENATTLLDGPAVTQLKRKVIVRGEWMEMLRMFMPAAQACRQKLGRCLNPDNVQQQRDYKSLLLFLVDVELVTKGETKTFFNLPPCDSTMIKREDDKKLSDDIITYVEGVVEAPAIINYEGSK